MASQLTIVEYVQAHAARGECRCGRCVDRGTAPEPKGHTADVYFFLVAAEGTPDAGTFRLLSAAHHGDFCACDPFDGKEHSYIELGGWIGDQGLALQYMGLGAVLGVFDLLTPKLLPLPKELQDQMAGAGMIAIQAAKPSQPIAQKADV